MKLGIVILAAGQGTRMRSSMPKVLHRLAGLPLLQHVVDAARELAPERCVVVYGHGGERVRDALAGQPLVWVEQSEQRGTGHAVMQAMPALSDTERVLVLYGDVPLIRPQTLKTLIDVAVAEPLALLSLELEDPGGYGRVLRDPAGRVVRIVEQRDASPEELEVQECNTGIMCADTARLGVWLDRIGNDNAQGEYYLTDIVGLAVADGAEVAAVIARDPQEVTGVNDRIQLAALERGLQRARAEQLMRAGVTLLDPARFDLRGTLRAGQDVVIDVNVILEGAVSLGDGVQIGANTVIRNSEIGPGVQIRESCVIEDARIGADSRIGPFARIRPDTNLAEQVHIGNFVEIKKSEVGFGSKINHLSYVGDTSVGRGVNIGAGTITCNYDGANKHRTLIGDGAFIGSDTQLVAPVEVEPGATIGAGSTITRNAPANKLTLSRARQMSIDSWRRPVKKPRSED